MTTFVLLTFPARSIWEKKYGKNANHVKKQRESGAQGQQGYGQQRQWNNGKGSKGPAQEGGGGKPGQGQGPPPRGRGGPHGQRGSAGGSGGFAPPLADRGWPKKQGTGTDKKKDDKPLHPSWEAKRKLKEKLNPSIVPAQGKKIKFS